MGRWVFIGYIGAGNVGDDLMAERFLAQLDPASLSNAVFLGRSSERPGFLRGVPIGYARASLKAAVRNLIGATGLVLVGGTNFHDAVSDRDWPAFRRKLLTLAAAMGLCRALGGRVVHLAIGVGPLRRRDAQRVAALALRLGSAVIVRDRQSFEVCRSLGIRNVCEARDLAFLEAEPAGPGCGETTGILGIAPTTLANLPDIPDGIDGLFWKHMADRIGAAVVARSVTKVRIFAFNVSEGLSDDQKLCLELDAALRERGVETDVVVYDDVPATILRSMQECTVFMAFRYHSAITAALLGKKLILVPYHRKVEDLVEQLVLDRADVLNAKQSSIEAIYSEIDRIADRLDKIGRPAIDHSSIDQSMREAFMQVAALGLPLSRHAFQPS